MGTYKLKVGLIPQTRAAITYLYIKCSLFRYRQYIILYHFEDLFVVGPYTLE